MVVWLMTYSVIETLCNFKVIV